MLVILFRQPGANIIDTVDSVKAAIPQLMAAMPADMDLLVANDRTTTIRASLHVTETTLLIAVGLVTLVVFLFLRNVRATLIPAIAVPVSIIGTFGTMYLMGYSLDNLSLMALTVATGFVVDDAIVVLENISRHIEAGMPRVQAALLGAREVGFTVHVDQPVADRRVPADPADGRHRRPAVSRVRRHPVAGHRGLAGDLADHHADDVRAVPEAGRAAHGPKRRTLFDRAQAATGAPWLVAAPWRGVMLVLLITVGLNVVLLHRRAERLFPAAGHRPDDGQPPGRPEHLLSGHAGQADRNCRDIVQHDPAVQSVVGFTGAGGGGGGGSTNTGSVFVALKPLRSAPASTS